MRTNWKSRAEILEIQNDILREIVDTAIGARKTYRVIDTDDGTVLDLDDAQRVADYLFAVGGYGALRRFMVYKEGRPIKMPSGGEVGEIAQLLEAA